MVCVVNDKCTKCFSCTEVCPVDSFHEDEKMVLIDSDVCIGCGVCISECPASAISDESDADEKWVKYNAEKSKNCPQAKKD